jgi:hypothetical protein
MSRLLLGASRRAPAAGSIETKAKGALKLAFPDCQTMAGPIPGEVGIGFGIIEPGGTGHAVRVGSYAEYPDAIGMLKARRAA